LASETYTSIEAFRTDLAELSTSPDATITLSKTQGYLEDDREGLTGILAGLDGNLWTSGSRLHFLLNSGDLAQYLPLRTVASQEIASFNPAVNTDPWQNSAMPSAIGGAYRGFLGGAVKGDQTGGGLVETFQGMFSALYYNSNNNDIGILYAPLTGDVYQSLGAIVSKDPANNLLIPYKLGTAALDPETFVSQSVSYSGLDDKLFWNTDGTGGLPGQHVLIGGAGSDAWIRLQSIKQASMSIMYTDQTGTHSVPWSIWQYTMTGLYGQSSAGKYPEDWRWTTSSFADGAQESRIILSGQPIANGYVEGVALQSNAVWTPPDNRPVPYTSLAGGEIKGLFDPGKATWQMIAQGAGMETSAFLAHVNALQSDEARQAFYRATKIPCFEVGRTDLKAASVVQGSNGTIDMTGVHGMKDVTFFAPTSGATLPQIWGTNAVSGGYTGNPQGIPVPLSNTGNTVSAMFNMQSWNTGTQNWGATVTGGQAAVDALKPGSDAFGFSGGAAGKIDQPQSGVFTGTAAGIVH